MKGVKTLVVMMKDKHHRFESPSEVTLVTSQMLGLKEMEELMLY